MHRALNTAEQAARSLDRERWTPSEVPRPVAPPTRLAVDLDRVSKRFEGDGATALADVCLAVPERSTCLIEGPSGSGKTTLLALMGCMLRPTAGRIRIDGTEVTRLPEDHLAALRRRRIGFVFQSHHLIRGASAVDNVEVPAIPCPEVDGRLRDRSLALLARFGLADRADTRVERLSGGEQQRVAIARALMNRPSIVLADEPTAHLDADTAETFLDLVDELRAGGVTVVVASHDPVVCGAGSFAQVVRLRAGRLE